VPRGGDPVTHRVRGGMVHIRRERPSQRLHHRVTAPLRVDIADGTYDAVDWSLTGFGIDGYDGPGLPGEILSCTLYLPFQGFGISFACDVTMVRRTETGNVGFTFNELGERETEIMRHFVDDLLRGAMVSAADTILRIDTPVTPVPTTPDQGVANGTPLRRWSMKALAMGTFYSVAGLGVIGYAVLALYANFWRLEIETAVVSAPVQEVVATADGRLTAAEARAGALVEAGAPLFLIEDPGFQETIDRAEIAVERAAAELQAKREELAAERARLADYRDIAIRQLRQSEVTVRSLEEQIALIEEEMKQTAAPTRDGGRRTLTSLPRQLAELKGELDRARLLLEERNRLVRSFEDGRFFNNDDMEGRLNELAAAVSLHESRVELERAELQALQRRQQSLTVVAPVDGRLIRPQQAAGSFVRRGDQLALFERNEARTVQAFLTQEEVLQVGLDDGATVYFPSLDQRIEAVVVAIDRTTGFVDEMDAQYTWRGPRDRSARVTLAFVDLDVETVRRRYQPGLPATVIFERRNTDELTSSLAERFTSPVIRVKFPEPKDAGGDAI